jgi:hypothetical protein
MVAVQQQLRLAKNQQHAPLTLKMFSEKLVLNNNTKHHSRGPLLKRD